MRLVVGGDHCRRHGIGKGCDDMLVHILIHVPVRDARFWAGRAGRIKTG